MGPFFPQTILQPGIAFTTSLLPEMPLLQRQFGLEAETVETLETRETAGTHVIVAHQTNLTLPSAQEGRLDLHVDNCRRRCVTISDSQRILQFGH
jgi:hypothetical protein